MLTIKPFRFNPLGVNTYVVSDETGECAIVDPACAEAQEEQELAAYIDKAGLTPKVLLFTHLHFDHVYGGAFAAEKWHAASYASEADRVIFADVNPVVTQQWGLPVPNKFEITHAAPDGQEVTFGHSSFVVLATPGHSPGGVCYYCKAENVCFSGDTLFRLSVGRTDLGGDQASLINSIRTKLMTLPGETVILPGHGPATNINDELAHNPYLMEC